MENNKPIVIKKQKSEANIVDNDNSSFHLSNMLANIPKNSNQFLRKKELIEYEEEKQNEKSLLYPTLNDPLFSEKIAIQKEFANTKYEGDVKNIKEYAEKMCSAEFELMPHQLFVKNFLSFQTPYNSLLLYHGLGSGKTCSSIGIAEEMRKYMNQVGIKQRIIVIAAPNVQENYKLQLFDERKLKEKDGIWNIDSCVGDAFIKEVNPTSLKNISREKIISQIYSIIKQYYVFMGYVEFANYIRKKITVPTTGFTGDEKQKMETQNMKKYFNNRLIIIDEVHNIRLSDDNKDDKTGKLLMKLAKTCNNMRLLLLSATPMYNSHNEIIWLTNLMNANDKRGLISYQEVFDVNGEFREEKKDSNNNIIEEGGKQLLQRKLIGYISYVRGENPYTFPYRIYPNIFAKNNTFSDPVTLGNSLVGIGTSLVGANVKQIKLPTIQLNEKKIDNPLTNLPLYITEVGSYQEKAYNLVIDALNNDMKKMENVNFDEIDRFGFRRLQTPLEILNMVYPSTSLDNQIEKGLLVENNSEISEYDENVDPRGTMVGKRGMKSIMNYLDESNSKIPRKYNFSYKPEVERKYGRIFHSSQIGKYSAKISKICNIIKESKGIILIYSQYIDGGIVPMALALEEMGFTRFGTSEYTKPLFEKNRSEKIDALTMKPITEVKTKFQPAKYVMITGDRAYSPQNAQDVKEITNPNNKNGEKIKVVLISKAGSEGLDFKCIRQIHILEPWYNMNRIEQIIGRGVRNLSHCLLPFEDRNVEIYMHGTVLQEKKDHEPVDIHIYRLAKKKAEKIGKVTRIMKESSVDCVLNIGQKNFTVEKLQNISENQNMKIRLPSNNQEIDFKIGDSPHSAICDYMESCDYKCNNKEQPTLKQITENTYSTNFLQSNNNRIMMRIRDVFREKGGEHFYTLNQLIDLINVTKQYPIDQIYSSLYSFIKNDNEYLIDKYGRRGNLKQKGNIYAFQPIEINDENITVFERKVPVDYKRSDVIMEIPKDFSDVYKDEEPEHIIDSDSIIRDITINLNNATKEQEIQQGDLNWYKHASKVLNHLQLVHNVSYENYVKFIIHHNIDMLMPESKLLLLSRFYGKVLDESKLSEVEKEIKNYLDKMLLVYKNKNAFLIINEKNWTLYLLDNKDSGKWIEAEPEDIRLFEQSNVIANKFKKNPTNYFSTIGFINMFRNKQEMAFKIKNLRQMQNNTGTKLDGRTPGKGDIIQKLNEIVHSGENVVEPMYNLKKSKEIMQLGFCVILEIIIRNRTMKSYQDKIWYLTPEEANYNDIAKFRQK